MTTQRMGLFLLAIVAVFFQSAVGAEPEPAAPTPTMSDVMEAVNKLSTRVEGLASELETMKTDLGGVQQKLAEAPLQDNPSQDMVRVDLPAESASGQFVTKAEFDRVKGDLQDLIAVNEDRNQLLGDLVGEMSTTGGSGKSIPNVRAIMQDPVGRQDLNDAVHEVMRRSGTLVVENRMSQGYTLRVNRGESHYVAPHETKRIPVSVGTITTELVGYESPKNWAVSPPDYEQKIAIGASAPQQVVVRSPVWVERPVRYYWDPVWGWVSY